MAKIGRGGIAALLGVALLGSVIGYREFAGASSEPPVTEGNGMSLPPSLEELARRAEADPDNPIGWQELGLNLFAANRFGEAADAYARAVAADPDSALLWSSLGEARVMASERDPMPDAARTAFRRALAIDPDDHRARYFLAVDRDLGGDHEGAIDDWLALLAITPPGAPWEADLVRTIQQVGAIHAIEVADRIASVSGSRGVLPAAVASGNGPTAEQIAAAAAIPPSEQEDMAEAMVARLARRIAERGGDVDEWIMLMRSYDQLGRSGDARRARDSAIAAHPDARARIESTANALGIG